MCHSHFLSVRVAAHLNSFHLHPKNPHIFLHSSTHPYNYSCPMRWFPMTSATSINAVIYIPKMTARWSLALLLLPLLLLLTNVDAYQIRHVPIDTLSPVVGSRGVVSANGSARGHDHHQPVVRLEMGIIWIATWHKNAFPTGIRYAWSRSQNDGSGRIIIVTMHAECEFEQWY